MINLEQLLLSRDARVAFQKELLESHPGSVLICLTVQLPGSVKRNATSLAIAHAGCEALRQRFPGCELITRDLETGFEAFLPLPMDALEAKRITCQLEETHPLGRLMDVDVIGPDGPVSRADVGLDARRCLLCGQPVRYCMRARTHTTQELLERMEQMVNNYTLCHTEN